MVRSAVQVSSGATRFRVAVQAESIERALEIAKKQGLGRNSEVTFLINSEVFFAAQHVAVSGSAKPGRSAAKPGGRVFNLP
jgi:type III secretory pathway lipoprotein EscJ